MAGKRTWTVSGTAATFSGTNVICQDKFQFDDYPEHSLDASNQVYIYGDDDLVPDGDDEFYVKTVIVNH